MTKPRIILVGNQLRKSVSRYMYKDPEILWEWYASFVNSASYNRIPAMWPSQVWCGVMVLVEGCMQCQERKYENRTPPQLLDIVSWSYLSVALPLSFTYYKIKLHWKSADIFQKHSTYSTSHHGHPSNYYHYHRRSILHICNCNCNRRLWRRSTVRNANEFWRHRDILCNCLLSMP